MRASTSRSLRERWRVRLVDEGRYDFEFTGVRNNTLATLIHGALQNDNVVSRNRRRQFEGQVSAEVFELIERTARDCE